MSNHFIVNQIPSRGKTIIRNLYRSLHVFRRLSFETAIQMSEQDNCSKQLFQLIVDIAALCCGEDNWPATYRFLKEAGVSVPEDVCLIRQNLEVLMDDDFSRT